MLEPPALSFGGLLRQLRAQARLTQEELAEAAKVSTRSVSDLERGINRTARKDTAVLLAGALGLTGPTRELFVAAARGRAPAQDVLAAGMHGFPAVLTSFIGREGPVCEVAGLLERHRLVTVTGPGGAGKTRLAEQVARQVAGRFADGAWLVELAPVRDEAQVAAAAAAALGVREQPGVPAAEAVGRVLARQQLLLVLDNCEHVIGAAAELCAGLLAAADDVRVLATSREPLAMAGEARYRLGPLTLPGTAGTGDGGGSEAVALFADRARSADPRFALDEQAAGVARLVTRLDGMPLAIELAAARAESLGVNQLLDRLDDRFALLADADRLAVPRQRSLAATVEWSYQLLDEPERRVFRAVSVFPAGFTLEAAEAVAGQDAAARVLRLVDCSLLVPPRAGPDGQARYSMLETLRAYAARLLAEADEQDQAAAALARYAVPVAGQAAARMTTIAGEPSAVRRLDAEDATMTQVLAWAVEHDLNTAARLVTALGLWWTLRGRLPGEGPLLRELARRAEPGSEGWCAAQFRLALAAMHAADPPAVLQRCAAVVDVTGDREPSPVLADCLALQSVTLANLGRLPEADGCARRALALARGLGYPSAQAYATNTLAIVALYAGDPGKAVQLVRHSGQIPGIPRPAARMCGCLLAAFLGEAGDLAAAEQACATTLAQARDAGDLYALGWVLPLMADLEVRAGRAGDAAAHLREAVQIALQSGAWNATLNVLEDCGHLCAATGRPAEAITAWAAYDARIPAGGDAPGVARRREEPLRAAWQALGPDRARAAEQRGTAMSLAAAVEYALLLTEDAGPRQPETPPALAKLSARERELVTLVAQGRTNGEIAAQLFISIRTVASHLERIRDKSGCRRRADLTRLALTEGLI
jgi:predicted ATPase/DNA-binding CsgD family transcriptional regulator/DNA-binding XRE family transcriptional regulator